MKTSKASHRVKQHKTEFELDNRAYGLAQIMATYGCRVLIANPRKLRAIYHHERKSDRRDAQMLAHRFCLHPP